MFGCWQASACSSVRCGGMAPRESGSMPSCSPSRPCRGGRQVVNGKYRRSTAAQYDFAAIIERAQPPARPSIWRALWAATISAASGCNFLIQQEGPLHFRLKRCTAAPSSYRIQTTKKRSEKSQNAWWLRGPDLNQRPSGYEPDELPDCSTPRYLLCALSGSR